MKKPRTKESLAKKSIGKKIAGNDTIKRIASGAILLMGLAVIIFLPYIAQLGIMLVIIFFSHHEWQKLSQYTPRTLIWSFVGFFYMLLVTVAGVYLLSAARLWFLTALVITASADVGALYGGKLLGRHRLAPTIGPKKTWEGAFAGLLCGAAAGVAMGVGVMAVDGWRMVVISVMIVVAGIIGDLFESKLKRGARVKDSGRIIPGHGGLLDRLDSHFMAVIVTAIIVWQNW